MKKFLAFFSLLIIQPSLFSQIVSYDAVKLSKLNKQIFETSGLVYDNGFLWTLNDGGNGNFLYKIDTNGKLIKKVVVNYSENIDWEELTQDSEHLYIGDFGNNSGNRQSLRIVIVNKKDLDLFDTVGSESFEFKYPDQFSFKNKRQKHNFDCEAMICTGEKLLLFSKNWKDKKTKVYSLDINAKNQTAVLIDSFNIKMLVTGASFDPLSNQIVLIGYKFNKIHLQPYVVDIKNYSNGKIFNGEVKKHKLKLVDCQTEAIAFVPGKDFCYITREGVKVKKTTFVKPALYKLIPNYMSKNGYKLKGSAQKNGYDWWWHSFVGKDAETGELKPFFIEYYVINPGLWKGEIVLGQLKRGNEKNIRPCYAMIKSGAWGNNKSQLHNFFGIDDFKAEKGFLDCSIGNNIVTENKLQGEVYVSRETSINHPEMMSDPGTMKWDLTLSDKITYDVGYGSSDLSNKLHLFQMYWHVQGMRCKYSGTVIYNGRKYTVEPNESFGYQDKNWGRDYTNPWIWLNCNNFISVKTGKRINASLDIGGGCPKVLGVSLNRRIITAFYYEGEIHEFNFSKFWLFSRQKFNSYEDSEYIYWEVTSENKTHLLEINFKCKKEFMLLVNYENPQGEKNHNKLWNGGHAFGTVKFYKKGKELILVDELNGSYGGCEYGEY